MLRNVLLTGTFGVLALAMSACVSVSQYETDRRATDEKLAKLSADAAKNAAALNALKEAQKKESADMISLKELFENMEYGNLSPNLISRYVDSILPPENATPAQKREFIGNIAGLRVNFNSDKVRLKIVNALVGLGHEYLDDLLSASNSSFCSDAVQRLAKPSDKAKFKQMLQNPQRGRYAVVSLYANLADASDRKDVLALLPSVPELFRCVNRLGIEKEAAGILKQSMLSNPNLSHQYECMDIVLKNLDDADRRNFMDRFWKRKIKLDGNFDSWRALETGLRFVKYGYLPALEYLVENSMMLQRNGRLEALMILIPCDKPGDLKEWFAKNKANLVFNPETIQYELKTK